MPGAEITIVSGNPEHDGCDVWGPLDWVAGSAGDRGGGPAYRFDDLGGGGLFQDYWGFDPSTILTREHWGLSFYVAPALLSAIYGKPLMLYAVGAGPLLSDHGRKYTKVAGDIATRITVRDVGSKELFESLGVAAGKITLTADPAFDLTPSPEAAEWPEVREWKSRSAWIGRAVDCGVFADLELRGGFDVLRSRDCGGAGSGARAGGRAGSVCAVRIGRRCLRCQSGDRADAAQGERRGADAAVHAGDGGGDLVECRFGVGDAAALGDFQFGG